MQLQFDAKPETEAPPVVRYVALIMGDYTRSLVLMFESVEQANKHAEIMGYTILDLQRVELGKPTSPPIVTSHGE